MRRRDGIVGLALVVALLFIFLVPVIRFDTNVSPMCARMEYPGCHLYIQTTLTGQGVYWSVTAYYFGVGAYFVPPSDFGLIS